MTLHPTTLDEINFFDLEMFTDGNPHDAWSLLREEAPLWYHDKPGGEPSWCVSTFDNARAVHSDAVLYSSQRHGIVIRDDRMLESAGLSDSLGDGVNPMIHTDPPRHAPLRKVISHNFTPRSIGELEGQIRGYAVKCMDEAAEKGEIDFVNDIAHKIPAAIALSLMGVPEELWDRMAELEHISVTGSDPEFLKGRTEAEARGEAGAEMFGLFAELIMARMEDPGDDLLSQFLQGKVMGEDVPWQQVVAEAGLLLAGGLDTTRAAASAGAMLPLLERPDQLADLQADPSLIPAAIEEFVRWSSPVVSESRTVTADTELDGQPLSEGERVTIWTPSVNRDESHFPDGMSFDIRRTPNRHLGFAYGEHYCLGVHLARLTLKVEFEELFNRFSKFELTGEPKRVASNFVGGLKHLPLKVTPK